MATQATKSRANAPILDITGLDVYYGQAHALQQVSLTLERGCIAVVGRNGMGKTTLCNAVTGLVPARGSVKFMGEEILGLAPHVITKRGIGYVPQGRRVWPSLSVDEHLRLAASTARRGEWTVERAYDLFPRLKERRNNGGSQLSGGEQQMLAISRALLFNPMLLVMDEPTEGLAPVIVEQVANTLRELAHEGGIAILLIEQNLGVAVDVADDVAVMVNGRIARLLPAGELAADVELQQRLLGVKQAEDEPDLVDAARGNTGAALHGQTAEEVQPTRIFTVRRAHDDAAPDPTADPLLRDAAQRTVRNFNRWNSAGAGAAIIDAALAPKSVKSAESDERARVREQEDGATRLQRASQTARVVELPVAASTGSAAYVAGTFDTKGRELFYLKNCIEKLGMRVVTVDLGTSGKASPASVGPRDVARHHPKGERGVFTGDRGSAVTEMALAFERFILSRRDLGGLISAGGSGGTALATPAMRALAIGVPKMMVSTVASGDTKPYVGPSDICMMYSVTDVSGINRISERVLANAAHALAGMIAHQRREASSAKPSVGLTMFGVTTTCVQAVAKLLEDRYDPVIFHATGTGGQSFEKLADSALFEGVLDLTTTEIADELVGGVLSAGPARLDTFIRTRLPYVGSVGACDMVNFWAMETVPAKFQGRKLYKHNPNVTLMRTTVDENVAIGNFIVAKLNRMEGPVRFLLPQGGVSALDAPGKAFHDPAATGALLKTIEAGFRPGPQRKLVKLPYNINEPQFAQAAVDAFDEITQPAEARRRASG